MNIAIFGGTFNPFHNGHLKMLETVCKLSYIDKVLVIPDYIPPHKSADSLAEDIHRINMCRLMSDKFEKAKISTVEIDRKGKSYTLNTVKELKQNFPEDDFYFVCGGDMIHILDKWYEWEKFIKEVTFLAFPRNDTDAFYSDVEKMKKLGASIDVLNTVIPDISSTDFRNTLNPQLLPVEIYNYITEKGLYNAG